MSRTTWFAGSLLWSLALLALPAGLDLVPRAPADAPKTKAQGLAVGKVTSGPGTLLRQIGSDWQVVPTNGEVASGDLLLALPGEQANLTTTGGAIRLTLWANLPEISQQPVLESAVVLNPAREVDLDFTLQRGRVMVTNLRDAQPARIQVRFYRLTWGLDLEGNGEVALELYSRWPAGTPFRTRGEVEEAPAAAVVLVVLRGDASLKVGDQQFSLRAPPGPAYYHWDSERGADSGPKRRDQLPAWAAGKNPLAVGVQAALDARHRALIDRPAKAVLVEEASASDASTRRLAVLALAATDNLPHLIGALADPKHADVRQTAVAALQHWLGRGPRQGPTLYHLLLDRERFHAGESETLLQLLYGLPENARFRPETYQALIAYLHHGQLPIRELAHWQLERWVPAGKSIGYDAGAPETDRERAIRRWQELVPPGQLPQSPAQKP
jgi:hypothetical protein